MATDAELDREVELELLKLEIDKLLCSDAISEEEKLARIRAAQAFLDEVIKDGRGGVGDDSI